tara:strand:+ start:1218 stop:2666 length:1449 start_codon:yes stop_codon:yes gene_type:complete
VSNSINFENSFAKELNEICEKCSPTAFLGSEILLKNYKLAEELGLSKNFVDSEECLNIFSGVSLPENSIPIAQAYAGHQFGHFNPQLGDGRAILIGEINDYEIQLKGIGQTPFSRRGDGKSALGPVLREYVISEFMHSMGIPTTRSLFAIKTNEFVYRESAQPGGILARVARSHIRIGTFEYARNKNNGVLKSLADYSINRYYPESNETDNKYLSFFAAVCNKQALLISKWMSIGFIHGVMNTDNMTISGETIDYGPCAFMDKYDPKTVFSSIDHQGRYAYLNQPAILIWNLAKFAETLIPLIGENEEKSVKQLSDILQVTMPTYQEYFYKEMRKKLGLDVNENNIKIIEGYLKILQFMKIDFTLSFRDLAKILINKKMIKDSVFKESQDFNDWYKNWLKELNKYKKNNEDISRKMDDVNPCYIPRNHIIERGLGIASEGDISQIKEINELLRSPHLEKNISKDYLSPSSDSDLPYITYCGT